MRGGVILRVLLGRGAPLRAPIPCTSRKCARDLEFARQCVRCAHTVTRRFTPLQRWCTRCQCCILGGERAAHCEPSEALDSRIAAALGYDHACKEERVILVQLQGTKGEEDRGMGSAVGVKGRGPRTNVTRVSERALVLVELYLQHNVIQTATTK